MEYKKFYKYEELPFEDENHSAYKTDPNVKKVGDVHNGMTVLEVRLILSEHLAKMALSDVDMEDTIAFDQHSTSRRFFWVIKFDKRFPDSGTDTEEGT